MSQRYNVFDKSRPPVCNGHHAKSQSVAQSSCYFGGVCEKLRASLSSLCCESAVVTLTLLSVLAISGEILIDYGILASPRPSKTEQPQSSLSSSSSSSSSSTSNDTSSVEKEDRDIEIVQIVFHYISLVIAALFFLEIVLKMLVFRRKFCVQAWQVLDMLIVCVTLMVEVVFEVKGRIPQLEACTYVVLLRLWRLPHACNVKARELRRDMEQDLRVWKASKDKMEDKWRTLQTRYDKQKGKVERLEEEVLTLKRQNKSSQDQHIHPSYYASVQCTETPQSGTHMVLSNQHIATNHVLDGGTNQHTPQTTEDDITERQRTRMEQERLDDKESTSMAEQPQHTVQQSPNTDQKKIRVQIEEGSYENGGYTHNEQTGETADGETCGTYTTPDGIPMTDL